MDDLEEQMIERKLDSAITSFDRDVVKRMALPLTTENDEALSTVGEAFLTGYLLGQLQTIRAPAPNTADVTVSDLEDTRAMINHREADITERLQE